MKNNSLFHLLLKWKVGKWLVDSLADLPFHFYLCFLVWQLSICPLAAWPAGQKQERHNSWPYMEQVYTVNFTTKTKQNLKQIWLATFWKRKKEKKEVKTRHHHHHHRHLSLNCKGRWCTTDDFTTSFLHFSLFSTALWDLVKSRPVHSLMLSSHLFLCLPCLLPPFTVPCKMVLARPDEGETWPYHCSLRLCTIVRRSSCGPIACWILARTSSLVTWSSYEMCSILR